MAEVSTRALVIDDDEHRLSTVCRGLNLYGYRCQGVLDVDAAFAALEGSMGDRFDIVLTDLTRSSSSGLALIERVQQRWPELTIVVIAGLGVSEDIEAVRRMSIPILRKPFSPDALDATIRRALGRGTP